MRGLLALLLLAVGAAVGAAIGPYVPALLRPAPVPVTIAPRADLTNTEQSTVALFQAAQDSVVFISTTTRGMDLFRGTTEVPSGTGSGFVWDDRGHIITNAHVIRGAASATVRLLGGRAVPARLVGLDRRHDLAVLQVTGMGMRPLPLGTSGDLQVGQSVFAIGNPFGLDFTLTTGIVSALDREIPGEGGLTIRGLIQTDAAINPGNSGGPLLDSAGRLIGVNTAIFSPSGASAGIGFAVPVDTVARVAPQLIATGSYTPPSLGISADRRADLMLRESGVMVLDVTPGGPAAQAGLQPARITNSGIAPRDVIEAVDDEPVETIDDLLAVLDTKRVGQAVDLRIRRGDARRSVEVTLTR